MTNCFMRASLWCNEVGRRDGEGRLGAQRRERPGQQRDDGQQPESWEYTAHEGEGEADGELAGGDLRLSPSFAPGLQRERFEGAGQRLAIALGRGEGGDQRAHGIAERVDEHAKGVGERHPAPGTAYDL